MEAIYHRVSQKQRTGEPDMLKELMGPNFSKSIENSHFLGADQSENNSCSVLPKTMIRMERNYLMPVKNPIQLMGIVYSCPRWYMQ